MPECGTVEDWLAHNPEGGRWGVRRNGGGKVDIDVAVTEEFGWKRVVRTAKEITNNSTEIMVDPHLAVKVGDNQVFIKNIAGERICVKNELTDVRIRTDGIANISIPTLDSLLTQMLALGRVRKKDIGEIMRLAMVIQATDNEWREKARETWWPLVVAYLGGRQWFRDIYYIVTDAKTRNVVRQIRGKQRVVRTNHLPRLESTEPVYL